MQTEGPEIAEFLSQYFDENTSERPEFGLGFAALRRKELVSLARVAKLELNEALPQTQMVPIMNGWLIEGRFDKFVKQKVDQRDEEIQSLKNQVNALMQKVGMKDEKEEKEIEPGSMADLRAQAKEMGINSFGKSKAELKEMIDGDNVSASG